VDNSTIIKDNAIGKALTATFLFFPVAAALFLLGNVTPVAWLLLVFPVVMILISSVRITLYIYLFCLFVSARLLDSPPLLLSDAIAVLLMISFGIEFMLSGRTGIKYPAIAKFFLILAGLLIFITFFSYNYLHAITPILRVLVQLAVIIVIYNTVDCKMAIRLAKGYFWLAAIHSAYNMYYFILSGGSDRIFGSAAAYFDDLTMLAFPIGLAYYIWSRSSKQSFLYGLGSCLTLLGLLATQSRAPLVTPVWVGAIIILYSVYFARKSGQRVVFRRVYYLFTILLLFLIILVFSGIADYVATRFEKLPEMSSGTVWLRMSLWRTSINTFLENPLTGLGPGSFRFVESILPGLKFDVARLYLTGASAHNLFLHYLAETGIIGTLALLMLLFKNLRDSIKLPRLSKGGKSMAVAVGLMGSALAIFGSIFYMGGWMWGQNSHAAPFFIAIIARLLVDFGRENNFSGLAK